MASELGVQTIQHTNGTDAMTIDSSGIVDMPNTVMYDVYRFTTSQSSNGTLTAWENPDDALAVTVGDSMSESSGIFTFPRTGVYKVSFYARIRNENGDVATAVELQGTTDNSSYDVLAFGQVAGDASPDYVTATVAGEAVINISDTSNRKVRFTASSVGGSSSILGETTYNSTYLTFQYLAPAQ